MRRIRVLFVVIVIAALSIGLGFAPQPTLAATVTVGTEYPCTRDGLVDAMTAAGADGIVTFNCADPTISFTASSGQINIIQSVTIDGSNNGNPITLDGNDQTRFFYLHPSKLTLKHITLKDGRNQQGAIYIDDGGELDAFDVTFTSNDGGWGGAIANFGTATITQSRFVSNTASQNGGAIINSSLLTITQSTFISNGAKYGGAILNDATGTTTISQSRFISNTASTSGGVIFNQNTADITQSSFISNHARFGGVIFNSDLYHTAFATITQSTFSNNKATDYGSTVRNTDGSNISLRWSTIVQPENTIAALDVRGSYTLEGVILAGKDSHCEFVTGSLTDTYTLSNDSSCNLSGTGSHQNVTDLNLGPLTTSTVNGVDQTYYPLLESSPAIDGGSSICDTTIDPDTLSDPDQIGTPRPGGPACDIGAIEHIFSATLCANRWNGTLNMPSNQGCGRSETQIQLPQNPAPTACANTWNGTLRLADDCNRSEHQITLWSSHSHPICINRWNGSLRLSDHCTRSEHPALL